MSSAGEGSRSMAGNYSAHLIDDGSLTEGIDLGEAAGESSRDVDNGSGIKTGFMDWSTEAAGQRVAYDDLTAIDWIHEYTVEQLRQRILRSSGGVTTYFRVLADASQAWVVLILAGIAVGVIAAAIDIASNWLADTKQGICTTTFYLSNAACCYGLQSTEAQCKHWLKWAELFHVKSDGGGYVVQYLMFTLLSVVFAVSASYLVLTYAPYARQSGIPEIKTVLGGFVIRRFMGGWTLGIKAIGLCLSVASGLWLGKEGPLVHVACCCANLLMKPFHSISRNEARKREILSATAAAGISVAFGSPIGGVLFSLEQVSYYFPDKTMWQSFVCAMVAAVTLQFMNPFRTGKLVLYQVIFTRGWHDFELIPFCILGIMGGIYGGLFIKANIFIARLRKRTWIASYPIVEVLVVAFLSAVINYPNIYMRAQTSGLVANLFQECGTTNNDILSLCKDGKTAVSLLLLAAIAGVALAAFTFGLQIPAGILLPSMAIGALYGRAMGIIIQAWHRDNPTAWMLRSCEPDVECITPGVYAIVGAASALGGVTRMTVSIVVIMFELTGALTYVLPIMVAVLVSKWVGDAFDRRGIYEAWIKIQEYPFLDNRDDPIPDLLVSQVMTRVDDIVVIEATGHTLASLDEMLHMQPYKGFPVVADAREGVLLGFISRTELRYAIDKARNLPRSTECHFGGSALIGTVSENSLDMRPWMDHTPMTLPARSSLMLATSLFQDLGLRYLLFAYHGQLQGMMTKKDAWFVLNSADEKKFAQGTRDRFVADFDPASTRVSS
ncbi:hypothetical protein DRE_03783 [Drechslerella stenobrocha 248]|uniref:Chloride channel protein n=1 Tax=Drechslerella stenobrocha 248 TaxID=1043628 RepID=W7HSM4_9PEZI|nr:hypothetical protein DRE_03783 [Drechslerella stenobrocha 248]